MNDLAQKACVPCRGGVPPLEPEAIETLRVQVPEWKVGEVDGVKRISRTYAFPDFARALSFTNAVGELAEKEQHHPDIHLAWGRVGVEVWTHKIRGLHENDFILAAKTDALYEKAQAAKP